MKNLFKTKNFWLLFLLNYHKVQEKRGDLRGYFVFLAVTQLGHVAPLVSRAPPNPPLPAFLGANGIWKDTSNMTFFNLDKFWAISVF